MNNPAFYDAVLSSAGSAQQAWLRSTNGATYDALASAGDALADTVDALIAPIVGGPSLSQIELLRNVSSAVLANRYPSQATPGLYDAIATAIVTLWTRLSLLLTNQPVLVTQALSLDSPVVNGAYREVTPSGSIFPLVDSWWTSPAKLTLLQQTTYVRNAQGLPTSITTVNYIAGVAAVTVQDLVTYDGLVESSRIRSVS